MSLSERITFYDRLAEAQKQIASGFTKKIYTVGTLRLIVFVTGVLLIYFFYRNISILIVSEVLIILLFVLLLRHYNALVQKKENAVVLEKICRDELRAFHYDFSAYDGAVERIDPAHNFSFDLDIFGKKSLFRQLNRTSLLEGKKQLADYFEYPLSSESQIAKRQQAIAELVEKETFCLDFRVIGSRIKSESKHDERQLFAIDTPLSQVWKIGVWFAPFLFLGSLFLIQLKVISGGILLAVYLFLIGFSTIPMKQVKRIWLTFSKKVRMLEKYAQLFELVENRQFDSALLVELQHAVKRSGKASLAIKNMARYAGNLDLSFVFPVMFLLNPVFLWNVLYSLKIEKWITRHGTLTDEWFVSLAHFDALISLGTFAANNPDYVYPTMSDTDFSFTGKAMGHPQIPREKCVKNDINITRKPFFMIVTGANMAGKSTYLRTIGVNHLLASVGAPVCASAMTFSPGKLLTNLRTADSLVNNESYFFAELKRLRMIIEHLQSGEKGLFIILDEILKGTNSEDKQKGSFRLMKRLLKSGGNGIIATHDLTLGNLEKEFPNEINNFHFEADIKDDTLSFDYALRNGIAQNMNASFLMRQMGIT